MKNYAPLVRDLREIFPDMPHDYLHERLAKSFGTDHNERRHDALLPTLLGPNDSLVKHFGDGTPCPAPTNALHIQRMGTTTLEKVLDAARVNGLDELNIQGLRTCALTAIQRGAPVDAVIATVIDQAVKIGEETSLFEPE
ncbi:TPA: hypothetical protein ACNEJR_004683 [Escherichia coli]